jgi:Bacterial capsule synthesis protein PGA_cap
VLAVVSLALLPALRAARKLDGGERDARAAVLSGGHGVSRSAGEDGTPIELDVVASGDLLVHTPISLVAFRAGTGRYDFRPMFAGIRPVVRRAELAICHVETPIGAGPPSPYPLLNAPTELANAVRWTGWDACTTASNHAVDKGEAGVASTLRALHGAGVRTTGTARTRAESRRLLLLRVRGVKIALLAYTYGTNGLPPPRPWSVNVVSIPRIVRDASRARRLGADLVLVNLHWGSEYVHEPSPQQRGLARYLLRHRVVDAIVGQHAHVVQPIRRLFGRFVVFGAGNLISAQTSACCPAESQDGLIAVLRVRAVRGRARVVRVDYVPTRVHHPGFRVLDVASELRRLARHGEGGSEAAKELRASYFRTVSAAGRRPLVGPLPGLLPRVRD